MCTCIQYRKQRKYGAAKTDAPASECGALATSQFWQVRCSLSGLPLRLTQDVQHRQIPRHKRPVRRLRGGLGLRHRGREVSVEFRVGVSSTATRTDRYWRLSCVERVALLSMLRPFTLDISGSHHPARMRSRPVDLGVYSSCRTLLAINPLRRNRLPWKRDWEMRICVASLR